MRKLICVTMLSFGLSLLVAGCVVTQGESAGSVAETGMAPEKETVAEQPSQAPTVNPCEAVYEGLVQQARTIMKTVYGSCEEKRVEANPMWKQQYDGEVRLRIYDAAGNLVDTQQRKP